MRKGRTAIVSQWQKQRINRIFGSTNDIVDTNGEADRTAGIADQVIAERIELPGDI